ncbi:LMBR1 domain-containing protein 2 homolog [Scaptodrosophila lebanonensis]|uniref:LMBR1 domain-containing protein 2 homolog n=1 Tax=Drosophila lebanonensis TaxID=7225 RepID=A0A6J2TID1_DROLE|nr:LMBR1 domain-containing protein 2 homolog [Scaptodrosophila lebanonensis]
MAYLLTFGIIASLFLASISLYRYGNIQRQHILVTISVLTAWCFSFLIVFTIPLDVTSTLYRQCLAEHLVPKNGSINISTSTLSTEQECQAPWGMVPETVFPNLWRIIYWSSQFLTWLIMPLMQSYLKAGDFNIKGKLKSALIENAIYYGSYLFICGVLLIYIAAKGVSLDWQKLKAIASSASNTWGLFLLVLLLGYALVEVPRSLWNNAKPGYTLQYAYFKAAKLSTDKAEAEEHVDDVLESLQCISRAVPNNHELRPCVETILRKVPIELQERASRNYARSGGNGLGGTSSTIVPSEKALVRIHKQVIKSLQTLQRTEALWSVQVEKVMHLEDVARNIHSAEHRFKTEFSRQRSQLDRICYSPTVQWYWECLLRAPFLKTLCVLSAVMSAMVVWSELTFFSRHPVLSIFANVINVAKSSYDFFTIELFSMIVLCYFFYCTYSTILRIRFLNLYYLAPHHQTNEHSLIFSGMLLCRLTPPMCLNFLGLIHMDSHIIQKRIMETYYTQIMGHMDVIGIIANGFNIYFPMCMLAFCLATWFSVGSRALNALGFQQFLQNETLATELVQEGKDLIAREKRRRQRAEEAMARRRDFSRGGDPLTNASKYRSLGGAPVGVDQLSGSRTPADGLLRDGEGYDYAAVASSSALGVPRSLSEEINERFGVSTHVQVGFKGTTNEQQPLDEYEHESRIVGPPPRGLFDDV